MDDASSRALPGAFSSKCGEREEFYCKTYVDHCSSFSARRVVNYANQGIQRSLAEGCRCDIASAISLHRRGMVQNEPISNAATISWKGCSG